MKLRIKLDDEPIEFLKNRPQLSEFVKQFPISSVQENGMSGLRKGAEILAEGAADLADVNRQYVTDSASDVVSVARSLIGVRTPRDLLEHQIGVGLMTVTGAVNQFDRVRDIVEGTGKSLSAIWTGPDAGEEDAA